MDPEVLQMTRDKLERLPDYRKFKVEELREKIYEVVGKKIRISAMACAANCEIEGVDYAKVYEVTTSGTELTLGYVAPGGNVGSRT